MEILPFNDQYLSQCYITIEFWQVSNTSKNDSAHINENMNDLKKQTENLKKKERMYTKYGKIRTERYVTRNMGADKQADKAMELPNLTFYKFNPY